MVSLGPEPILGGLKLASASGPPELGGLHHHVREKTSYLSSSSSASLNSNSILTLGLVKETPDQSQCDLKRMSQNPAKTAFPDTCC